VISLDESAFRLEFGAAWRHVKRWDEQPEFKNGIRGVNGELDGRPEGTKAVDFVGVRAGDVWLFEIKDFRNRPAQWQKRIDEIPLEMALKARDTIAGVVGSRHRGSAAWAMDAVATFAAAPITVVVLLARPVHSRRPPTSVLKTQNDVLMKQIKQKLAWLTRSVYVVDPMLPEEVAKLPEIVIASLAQ
jgi:hypothetical protein